MASGSFSIKRLSLAPLDLTPSRWNTGGTNDFSERKIIARKLNGTFAGWRHGNMLASLCLEFQHWTVKRFYLDSVAMEICGCRKWVAQLARGPCLRFEFDRLH